jgi:hypothetical protein
MQAAIRVLDADTPGLRTRNEHGRAGWQEQRTCRTSAALLVGDLCSLWSVDTHRRCDAHSIGRRVTCRRDVSCRKRFQKANEQQQTARHGGNPPSPRSVRRAPARWPPIVLQGPTTHQEIPQDSRPDARIKLGGDSWDGDTVERHPYRSRRYAAPRSRAARPRADQDRRAAFTSEIVSANWLRAER